MADIKPSRSKVWRRRAIEAVLIIVVVAGVRAWQQRDVVSGPAPALSGVSLNGSRYSLPAYPDKPVLVHFWATWCPVCRAEQGSIQSMAQDHPEIITVAMQSGSAIEVAKHLDEQGLSFLTVNDADGRISSAWGVHAVPASFIIGRDGQISFVEFGYTTEIGLRLRLWWAGL